MVTMTWGRSPPAAGRLAGGEGEFAGTDQAVEQPLRPGPQVQAPGAGIVHRGGMIRRSGVIL